MMHIIIMKKYNILNLQIFYYRLVHKLNFLQVLKKYSNSVIITVLEDYPSLTFIKNDTII